MSTINWSKIEDIRDPAICTPNGAARYEIADQADLENEVGELAQADLPALPAGATRAWQHGRRWLCE